MKKLAILAAFIFVSVGGSAFAADSGGACLNEYQSSLLNLTPDEVNFEVTKRYEEALDVSQRQSAIYSQSHLYTWANESKVACAKAIGFLKSPEREVNPETVSQCDCYYNRMQYYLLR